MINNIKIKVETQKETIGEIIDNVEGAELYEGESPDLLICDHVPDTESRAMYIVVWDQHDVAQIEKSIPPSSLTFRNLRGFFLTDEVKNSPAALEKTLTEVRDQHAKNASVREQAARVKQSGEYVRKGQRVKLPEKDKESLEAEFSEPKFTTLFTDKPMLNLMRRIGRILQEMDPGISDLSNHYKEEIAKAENGLRVKRKNEYVFDPEVAERLHKKAERNPVRIEPLLLTGETGVGKTLIARWIHQKAGFPGAFQEVNASALSETMLPSEMFGHVRGAFTDASDSRPGKAHLALGGVLFLDEIADIPLSIQPRIMKFIEEKRFTPEGWGSQLPFYTPMLIVAATNKDIRKEVEAQRVRRDFLARFKRRVCVPSIRERKESLGALIDLILQYPSVGKDVNYISTDAIAELKKMRYSENFRELERRVGEAARCAGELGLDIILPEMLTDELGISDPH